MRFSAIFETLKVVQVIRDSSGAVAPWILNLGLELLAVDERWQSLIRTFSVTGNCVHVQKCFNPRCISWLWSYLEGGGNCWLWKTLGRSINAWNLTTAWAKTRGS